MDIGQDLDSNRFSIRRKQEDPKWRRSHKEEDLLGMSPGLQSGGKRGNESRVSRIQGPAGRRQPAEEDQVLEGAEEGGDSKGSGDSRGSDLQETPTAD